MKSSGLFLSFLKYNFFHTLPNRVVFCKRKTSNCEKLTIKQNFISPFTHSLSRIDKRVILLPVYFRALRANYTGLLFCKQFSGKCCAFGISTSSSMDLSILTILWYFSLLYLVVHILCFIFADGDFELLLASFKGRRPGKILSKACLRLMLYDRQIHI